MMEQMDFSNVLRQVLKQWFIILMIGLIAAFGCGIVASRMYRPQYETSSIIVVYGKNASGGNIDDAEETAAVFQDIVKSNLLQKRVAEALELSSLPGEISCWSITNTNMITLKATADTPKDAMTVMNGVLDHYNTVTDSLLGDFVLQVLEEPKVPTQSTVIYDEPKEMLKAFLAAVAVTCCVMFGFYYFSDDIKNEEQVEKKLDTTLFASIYHEKRKKGIWFSRRKVEKTGLLVSDPVTSFGYVETLNKLCAKLEYKAARNNHKVILVTSVLENEGKSTVSVNLALSLAKKGKKVLLIDGDLRKPAQFKLLNQTYDKESKQLGGVLTGQDTLNDAVRWLDNEGIYLLAGNRSYKNATKILASNRTSILFRAVRGLVDYIILDTPPLYMAADTEELMRVADAGLLVVRQNCSKTKDINDAIDIFKKTECQLLGCVLNDVETGLLGHNVMGSDSYRYKYGYGYGYYKKNKEPKENV